jgi:hypothetical protein
MQYPNIHPTSNNLLWVKNIGILHNIGILMVHPYTTMKTINYYPTSNSPNHPGFTSPQLQHSAFSVDAECQPDFGQFRLAP